MENKKNNIPYFIKEVLVIIKGDISSNAMSVISLAFIFFIVTIVFSITINLQTIISNLKDEAEISVFYAKNSDMGYLKNELLYIDGVRDIILISQEQAKKKWLQL